MQLDYLGQMGRVEETHELMNKLELLEKERESERMTLSNSQPKVITMVIDYRPSIGHEILFTEIIP